MKKLVLLLAASGGLAVGGFVGCGGSSLCDRAEAVSKNLTGNCGAGMSGMMDDMGDGDCTESGCTDADKEKIGAFLDCAEKVGACVKGKELEWAVKIGACTPKTEGVSDACGAAGDGP